MNNNEILDQFGQLLIERCFDSPYSFILNRVEDLAQTEGYEKLFGGMSPEQKNEIELYTRELLKGVLFEYLKIYEENSQFKLYFENENQKVNLVEASEMLKAEPIIENGWIERFSRLDKE